MGYTVSLAELRRSGFVLSADEVVAIADQLIHQRQDVLPQPPFGPLAPDRIRIRSDGSVACTGCAATPTVAEFAILLQTLLERTPHVPGGLRYALARALHEVDVPPFDSLEDFWTTLVRYAPRRGDTLRLLVARRDRRKPEPSAADLRLQLREADRRLYESQARMGLSAAPSDARARRWALGVLLGSALTTIAAAGMAGDGAPVMPPMPLLPFSATPPALLQEAPQDVHPVIVAPVTGPAHAHPKHPVRGAHPRALRLRWLHTAIAIHDDLANR